MAWSWIRRRGRGVVVLCAVLPVSGCALLGTTGTSYEVFSETDPGPSVVYTGGTGTLELTGGETADVELSLVGGRFDPQIGASLDLRDDTGWAVTVALYAPSMGPMAPTGIVSVHRIDGLTHLVASDWSGTCAIDTDRLDAGTVRADATCQGMRWMDAIASTIYGPVGGEAFIGDPFDARITIAVDGPGTSPAPATPSPVVVVTRCLTLSVTDDAGAPVPAEALTATRAIIALRLERLGVDGATVAPVDDGVVVVGLPDGDVEGWTAAVSRPGVLALVPVPPAFDQQVIDGAPLPPGMEATPLLTHADIAAAWVDADQLDRPAIGVTLTSGGAAVLDAWVADNMGRRFAIVLDGIVVSAPVVNAPAFQGEAQISGDFTMTEAARIATALSTGPLPATVVVTSTAEATDGSCPS